MFSNQSNAKTRRRLPHRWAVPAIILLAAASVVTVIFGSGYSIAPLTAGTLPDVAVAVSAMGEPQDTPRGQATPDPGRTTGEVIVITPRGFEPNLIERPTGKYILALINRAEFDNMVIRLQSEDGGTILRTVEIPRNRRRMSVPVTLPPGRYKLVDLNRPDTVCNIEITQ